MTALVTQRASATLLSPRDTLWLALWWARNEGDEQGTALLQVQHLGGYLQLHKTVSQQREEDGKAQGGEREQGQQSDRASVDGRKPCLPVLGSLDSSPKPCVSFFFLQEHKHLWVS